MPLGSGTDLRLGHAVPPSRSRLRTCPGIRRRMDPCGDDTKHASKIGLIPKVPWVPLRTFRKIRPCQLVENLLWARWEKVVHSAVNSLTNPLTNSLLVLK